MNHLVMDILLVEDNPGDARLIMESLKSANAPSRLSHVTDGVAALAFLRRTGEYAQAPRPDLILLDWNLPRKSGCEVLREIKADENLRRIPVVVLTSSSFDKDILSAYNLNANCFVTKPTDFDRFLEVIRSIVDFWLRTVKLPVE